MFTKLIQIVIIKKIIVKFGLFFKHWEFIEVVKSLYTYNDIFLKDNQNLNSFFYSLFVWALFVLNIIYLLIVLFLLNSFKMHHLNEKKSRNCIIFNILNNI